MAHEITRRKNGFHEMAYVGEKPWHGLGQELRPGAPIEEWITAAGMDWTIQRSKVRYAVGRGDAPSSFAEWADWHVAMRSDTKAPLGMVSDGFKFVQPRQTLEFFRDLVAAAGFTIETAGTLHGGRKFWALASIQAEDRIVGKDLVKGKLMVASACDGSMNTIAKNVAERVVCANTLAIALSEGGAPEVRVSHRSTFNEKEVKAKLGLAVDSFTRFIADARRLASRRVSGAEANALVAGALGFEDADEATENRAYRKILALFQGAGRGAEMAGSFGTAWGVVNAVTEYVDHHAQARSDSNRVDSAWFGRGDALKRDALERALELVA